MSYSFGRLRVQEPQCGASRSAGVMEGGLGDEDACELGILPLYGEQQGLGKGIARTRTECQGHWRVD